MNTTPNNPNSTDTTPTSVIGTKREAVRLVRKAQGNLERGDWNAATIMLDSARKLATHCAEIEGAKAYD